MQESWTQPSKAPHMTPHQSEAIVLRTWPFRETDQIVSLFTREQGRIKGFAKSAAKSRRRFGGALEPTTLVQAHYSEKPRRDLVQLESLDVIHSPLAEPVDYARATALSFFVEILEAALPERDPQDRIFRLVLSVTEQTLVGRIWMPVTYFALWITRLMGWLPDLSTCQHCGAPLAGGAWYDLAGAGGLFCTAHRAASALSIENQTIHLSAESLALALRILRSSAASLAAELWPRERASDLRRFAIRGLERQIEHRLLTASALAHLGG